MTLCENDKRTYEHEQANHFGGNYLSKLII